VPEDTYDQERENLLDELPGLPQPGGQFVPLKPPGRHGHHRSHEHHLAEEAARAD